ncbi:Copia protein [Symbiodinium microadriaticum]|uniref:Copia protein n=1 Tax=Symbiodinium microadriaticum TaxID=2951 RepID=A0A1Q9DL98_SYMMI|nr:Copia protein [Symbiodinium microadriaticum]
MQDAEPLLQAVADMKFGQQRSMSRDVSSSYQTFGMYSHGNHYGITSKTTILPQVTKYLNQWVCRHLPPGARWSSFVVSKNARLPVHRDNHNDSSHSNYLLGVGNYEGGELWVEAPPGYEGRDACAQVSMEGKRLWGRKIPTLGQCVEFSPQEALAITIMTFNHRDLVRGEPLREKSYWSKRAAPADPEPGEADEMTLEEQGGMVGISARTGNQHGFMKTLKNLPSYFVGALKRKAVEVSERKLNEEQKAQFRAAKTVEVRNFIAAKAFETLPEGLRPSKEQAIHMRWILTWKPVDGGGQKAKARAVLLGYQDPKYEHRATTAPVMTRQTRQMQLQLTAMRKWQLQKGDVSGAFLQGREYPDELFCVPCPEICQAMGLAEGTVTRLRRACYGLVDAPLEWYRTVDSFLQDLGLERTQADACAWVWRPEGRLRGMISGHVDDFLFSGGSGDRGWQAILDKIKQQFKWGDWEQDRFVQCGVQVEKTPEGFSLSQPQYLEGVKEIPLPASRRKERDAPTTEREKTQLRALLGAISWHAQQVGPHLSAEVSLLLSDISESTVETIIKANQLAYHARTRKDHKMLVHAFAEDEPVALFGWVDAANENRRDGGSTQGIFIGLGPASMLSGELGKVTPIAWHSNRIDRVCRSPGAAEAQAAVNGEDALYFARFQWGELVHGQVNVRRPNETVTKVTGCLVTDSRNVYDKLVTEVLVIKGKEKKTNIELLALKEAQKNHGVIIRWVHSEAQLANALTKHSSQKMELYYRMQHTWRIVEDDQMMSARRRKTAGLAPLGNGKKVKRGINEHGGDSQLEGLQLDLRFRREADRLGAPSPLPGCAVALTTEQEEGGREQAEDLRAAFSLLDHDRLGELGALQARDFLICAGWCLPEDVLDDALAAVLSKSSLPADARFTFAQLLAALRLAEALLGVSTEDGLDMGRLQEVVCEGKHPALSLQELGDVLEAVGIYDEELRIGIEHIDAIWVVV